MGWRFSGLPFDFATFVQAPPGYPEIPRLVAVVGASFGDSALHASMGHFVVMTQESAIALVGPPVVASAIGEELTPDELGGPRVSTEASGYAHAAVEDDAAAIAMLKRALSYLPDHADAPAPVAPPAESDARPGAAPDARARRSRAAATTCGRCSRRSSTAGASSPGRSGTGRASTPRSRGSTGRPVGVLASQPLHRAGVLDVPALAKLAQFADLCDTFNLPLVFLQDVPGLMVGSEAERGGILAGYERVVARLARATVPKVVVVVRKAYGGGHFALGGPPDPPRPAPRLADRRARLHGARDRRAHRLQATPRGDPRARKERRRTRRSSPSCSRSGRTSRSRGRRPSTSSSTTSSTRAARARL